MNSGCTTHFRSLPTTSSTWPSYSDTLSACGIVTFQTSASKCVVNKPARGWRLVSKSEAKAQALHDSMGTQSGRAFRAPLFSENPYPRSGIEQAISVRKCELPPIGIHALSTICCDCNHSPPPWLCSDKVD